MVTRSLPLNLTIELPTKLEPFTVNVNAASPTSLALGLMLLKVGTGLLTSKSSELEVPPPGLGLKTLME